MLDLYLWLQEVKRQNFCHNFFRPTLISIRILVFCPVILFSMPYSVCIQSLINFLSLDCVPTSNVMDSPYKSNRRNRIQFNESINKYESNRRNRIKYKLNHHISAGEAVWKDVEAGTTMVWGTEMTARSSNRGAIWRDGDMSETDARMCDGDDVGRRRALALARRPERTATDAGRASARWPSYLDRTGPAVRPVKDRTRDYNGSVRFTDRPRNWTGKNRLNRPVFYRTGEPAGSLWTVLV